jgi:acyl-CoA synthetase (AMP-forming)/AMP-acid ligase II
MDLIGAMRQQGNASALFYSEQRISYAALLAEADAVLERIGSARQLVFLEARNTPASIAAYLACLMGGHPVHLYTTAEREAANALTKIYEPNLIVHCDPDGRRFEPASERRHVFHPELRVLLATSGSTGNPKLVKLSRRNLESNAAAIAEYLELTTADRAATTLKYAHAFGLSVVNSHLMAGASLLLTDDSVTDARFWSAFQAAGATSFSGVPYSFELLQRVSSRWEDSPGLRYVAQAGGRLAPDLVRHYSDLGAKNGWRFYVMYGQTEASPRMAYLPPELASRRPDCIGVPIPGGQLEILGEDGKPIEAAECEGQLAYRGPNVMLGYASGPDNLAADETPERLLTGDVALRTREGLYRIVGRSARFVKPFGIRVNLDDVQSLARTIAPSSVCAGTDEHVVTALLPPDHEVADAVLAALADAYELPPFVFKASKLSEMPLLPSGKPDYRALLSGVSQASEGSAASGKPRRPFGPVEIILSRSFKENFLTELKVLLGLRPPAWEGVFDIYSKILGAPIDPAQSFADVAGDSLAYVQVHLALEEYLGSAPEGWEAMSVDELERSKAVEIAF